LSVVPEAGRKQVYNRYGTGMERVYRNLLADCKKPASRLEET
jgi:hypothetical protein